jgi:hypothetical protein
MCVGAQRKVTRIVHKGLKRAWAAGDSGLWIMSVALGKSRFRLGQKA